jgi:citrate/tricarballylate utilization protein
MAELNLFEEANRQLTICNACRYCEGFCPVFRAIETRRDFAQGDVLYLANLCHDCRACYYSCMFTPPHEFAINIPQILSEARLSSYQRWSWPSFLARAFKNQVVAVFLALAALAIVATAAIVLIPTDRLFVAHEGPGAFYEVVPYLAMVVPAIALFFYGIFLWFRGCVRSWSETGGTPPGPDGVKAVFRAIGAALGVRYLQGGGPGCYYPGEKPSAVRRIYHNLVVWGFLFDFASTTLAFIYQDLLHLLPPYALTSAPVVFGTVGGIALALGTVGLLWIKLKSDRTPAADGAYGMDYLFLVILCLTALSGLLLLSLRATPALGSLLVAHLALVAALFATAPYGKFVHAVYRTAALVRYYAEQENQASVSH